MVHSFRSVKCKVRFLDSGVGGRVGSIAILVKSTMIALNRAKITSSSSERSRKSARKITQLILCHGRSPTNRYNTLHYVICELWDPHPCNKVNVFSGSPV